MNAIDLSADIGLGALGIVTANLLIGLLIALRYSPLRYWPHRQFNIFWLHRKSGYAALILVLLHPLPLLFSSTNRFRLIDIAYPVHSPSQPFENTLGSIALYCLVVVLVTSYFRLRLGRRLWKAFHFVVYAAAIALFWHSIFTDPALKNTPIDPFDGEKVFIEICCVLIMIVGILRIRFAARKSKARYASDSNDARLREVA
jgi:methionine sulfoxide reductase heme-binding subunit